MWALMWALASMIMNGVDVDADDAVDVYADAVDYVHFVDDAFAGYDNANDDVPAGAENNDADADDDFAVDADF